MAARKKEAEGRELKANVWVGEPPVLYVAGSVPPAEHAELITNPKAWADGEDNDGAGDGDA